eukprot:2456728-Alexandrium_andersonii.AAC.1
MAAPSTGVQSGTHTAVGGKKQRGVPLQSTLRPVPLQRDEMPLRLANGQTWRGRLVQPYTTCPVQ